MPTRAGWLYVAIVLEVFSRAVVGWAMDGRITSGLVCEALRMAIRQALQPDGLNLLQANGAEAGQTVPHFHLHLIPRWKGDGKGFDWKLVKGDPDRIRATADRIRSDVRMEQV
ncbi:MAG: HIT domain-containing protein [Candidatus Methylomirabilales bacterium]